MESKIKVTIAPESVPQKFLDAIWIMYNLRRYKKIWETEFGAANRKKLQSWEDKADELLNEIIANPKKETP